MPLRPRSLSLNSAHVARVHRVIADSGVEPGMEVHSDADYDAWVMRILASHPAPRSPTLLFACGSLIWQPELEHVGDEDATARGWHRSFCFRMTRFRGTLEQPGLMPRSIGMRGAVSISARWPAKASRRRLHRFRPWVGCPPSATAFVSA